MERKDCDNIPCISTVNKSSHLPKLVAFCVLVLGNLLVSRFYLDRFATIITDGTQQQQQQQQQERDENSMFVVATTATTIPPNKNSTMVNTINLTTTTITMNNNTSGSIISTASPQQQKRKQKQKQKQKQKHGSRISSSTSNRIDSTFFLSLHRKEFVIRDAYSGMWWQSMSHFLTIQTSPMVILEGASLQSLRQRNKSVLMTRNHYDFAVEHLSIFFRELDLEEEQNNDLFEISKDALENYTNRVFLSSSSSHSNDSKQLIKNDDTNAADDVLKSTIAIVPFGLQPAVKGRSIITSGNNHDIRMLSLKVTLVSLWKLGIARAVVVGHSEQERGIVQELLQQLLDQQPNDNSHPILQLAFVNEGITTSRNIPKQAIQQLQKAMDGKLNPEHTEKWLGNTTSTTAAAENHWKYVYFTEPDLILHTHPKIVPRITKALQQGHVMAAHRLQLIQHESDFPILQPNNDDDDKNNHTATRTSLFLPALGKYQQVVTVDPLQGDACYDIAIQKKDDDDNNHTTISIHRPGKNFRRCKTGHKWWRCGYRDMEHVNYTDTQSVAKAFYRLEPYLPLIRLKHGTRFVLLAGSQQGRQCQLQLAAGVTAAMNNNNNNNNVTTR